MLLIAITKKPAIMTAILLATPQAFLSFNSTDSISIKWMARNVPQAKLIKTSYVIKRATEFVASFWVKNIIRKAASSAKGDANTRGIMNPIFYFTLSPCFIPQIAYVETSHHLWRAIAENINAACVKS